MSALPHWLAGSAGVTFASVASNADGRLEVFAIGGNGQLYHAFQTAPNGGWSGIGSLGAGL